MNIKNLLLLVFAILMNSCGSSSELAQMLKTHNVKNQTDCDTKNGYWYKGKCWANFDTSEAISVSEVDAKAAEQIAAGKSDVIINGKTYPVSNFIMEWDGDELVLASIYTLGDSKQTLMQKVPKKYYKSTTPKPTKAWLIEGDLSQKKNNLDIVTLAEGELNMTAKNWDEMALDFEGSVLKTNDKTPITISSSASAAMMGIGNATITVKGNEAYINGVLGAGTYPLMKNLIANHPEVKTLVLQNVPGSVNDMINMHTGRLVHEAGLSTKVLADSEIASGGVDLFCSGKNRIVTKGAKVGVHSWSGGDFTAIELPKDHPAHQYQIEYFNRALGTPQGEAFYFYTLEAAPFNNIHWMTENELKKWQVATQIIN